MEERLAKCEKEFRALQETPFKSEYKTKRNELQKLYLEAIRNTTNNDTQHLEMQLWKVCFHKAINAYRSVLKSSKLPQEKTEALRKGCKVFLAAAIKTYKSLLQEFLTTAKVEMNIITTNTASSSSLAATTQGKVPIQPHEIMMMKKTVHKDIMERKNNAFIDKTNQNNNNIDILTTGRKEYWALLSCHRTLVYLGDLERYYSQLPRSDGSTRLIFDYTNACEYYYLAIELIPGYGGSYNQLAIVNQTNLKPHRLLNVMHMYFNALFVAEQPFLAANDNLKRLFAMARNATNTTQETQHMCVNFEKDFESRVVYMYDIWVHDEKTVPIELTESLIPSLITMMRIHLYNRNKYINTTHTSRGSLIEFTIQLLLAGFYCINKQSDIESAKYQSILLWIVEISSLAFKLYSSASLSMLAPGCIFCAWLELETKKRNCVIIKPDHCIWETIAYAVNNVSRQMLSQKMLIRQVLNNYGDMMQREESMVFGFYCFKNAYPYISSRDIYTRRKRSAYDGNDEDDGNKEEDNMDYKKDIHDLCADLNIKIHEKSLDNDDNKDGISLMHVRRFLTIIMFGKRQKDSLTIQIIKENEQVDDIYIHSNIHDNKNSQKMCKRTGHSRISYLANMNLSNQKNDLLWLPELNQVNTKANILGREVMSDFEKHLFPDIDDDDDELYIHAVEHDDYNADYRIHNSKEEVIVDDRFGYDSY